MTPLLWVILGVAIGSGSLAFALWLAWHALLTALGIERPWWF